MIKGQLLCSEMLREKGHQLIDQNIAERSKLKRISEGVCLTDMTTQQEVSLIEMVLQSDKALNNSKEEKK